MKLLSIPVGVSDFEEIRRNGYYYVDMMGQKQKVAMDLDSMTQTINNELNISETGSMAGYLQNVSV